MSGPGGSPWSRGGGCLPLLGGVLLVPEGGAVCLILGGGFSLVQGGGGVCLFRGVLLGPGGVCLPGRGGGFLGPGGSPWSGGGVLRRLPPLWTESQTPVKT